MYKYKFAILLTLLFKIASFYSQNSEYLRQPIRDAQPSKDTIKLYLEDTAYYVIKDFQHLMNDLKNNTGYSQYFTNTHGSEFELRDNLPDGFYCLYNITKKQAQKMESNKKYFVASGEFKDGMKQGTFVFYVHPEYPSKKEPFNNKIEAFKRLHFKNDTIHGKVIEIINGEITNFGEYNMGLKDGFFYDKTSIILYKDGEIIKETEIYN